MKNFLVSHLTQIATYATIIVIFTQNVLFDREVACTCQGQEPKCNIYISLPIFIIILLLLWKDKKFNAACRAYCCVKDRKSQERFCFVIVIQMGKASVIGLLWVVSVLFDGDWYACCHNGLQGEEALIPCKKNRSLNEQAIVDDLKNASKIIGLFILLGLLFLIVCFSLLKWWKCCKECPSCCDCWKNCSSCFDGDEPYELILIQEEENIVNQILKEKAKEALKQKVKDILKKDETDKYMNCYNAAQQVIDQVWPEQGSSEGVTGPPTDPAPGPGPSGEAPASDPDSSEGGKASPSGQDSNAGGSTSTTDPGPGPSTSGAAPPPDQIELEPLMGGQRTTAVHKSSATC